MHVYKTDSHENYIYKDIICVYKNTYVMGCINDP